MKKYLFVFALVIFSCVAAAAPVVCKTLVDDAKYALKSIDWAQVIDMVRHGAMGNLVEVESADGDVVRIFVE